MSQSTENIEAKLAAYVDGELDEAGRAEIEKHLVANPQHRKLMEELMQMRGWIRALPRESAPGELVETLQGQMERSSLLGDPNEGSDMTIKLNRWPQYIALAAIFMLAVGLAVVVYVVISPGAAPSYTLNPPPRIVTDEAANEPTASKSASGPAARKAGEYATGSTSDNVGLSVDAKEKAMAKAAFQAPATAPGDALAMVPQSPMEQGVEEKLEAQARRLKQARSMQRADKVLEAQTQLQQLQKENRTNNPVVILVQAKDISGTSRQVTDLLLANNLQWEAAPTTSDKDAMTERAAQMRGGAGEANGGKGGIATTQRSESITQQSTTNEAADQALRSSLADSTTAPADIENDTLGKDGFIGGAVDQAKQDATTRQFAGTPAEVREGDAIVVRNVSWRQANEIKWSMVTRQVAQQRSELADSALSGDANRVLAEQEKKESQKVSRDEATTQMATTRPTDGAPAEATAATGSTTQPSIENRQANAKPEEASLLDAEIIDITPAAPAPTTLPIATTAPSTQESGPTTERANTAPEMNAEDKVDLVIIFQSQQIASNIVADPGLPVTRPTDVLIPDALPTTQPATQPTATTQSTP